MFFVGTKWTNGLSSLYHHSYASFCDYYAFFGDHCNTWVGRCTQQPWTGNMSVLHRNWHNGSYPVIATGVFCDNAPDFQDWPDWPNATHTDERCRQRCLANSPSALSASAQMSDDGNTVVVRLANTARTPTTVIVEVARGSRKDTVSHATLWMLSSPSGNMLDANTPAEPTRVSPVKSTAPANGSITLPAWSAAVVVMEYTGVRYP